MILTKCANEKYCSVKHICDHSKIHIHSVNCALKEFKTIECLFATCKTIHKKTKWTFSELTLLFWLRNCIILNRHTFSWKEIADILNSKYSNDRTANACRKKCNKYRLRKLKNV